MAFTTVTGSNGITSLVGTTGVDTATIVSLNNDVFVGGNTGNDTLVTALATGNGNLEDWDVRMGGGDDGVVLQDNLLDSFLSLDGEVLANDGNDVFSSAGQTIINSEVVGRAGNDAFTLGSVQSSIINGNSGIDNFVGGNVTLSNATILGGQGSDIMSIGDAANGGTVAGGFVRGSGNNFNGNRGDDNITITSSTMASSTLFGGQGSDTLTLVGTIDGNTLSGDLGNDVLVGGVAEDILLGGDGADTMNGGLGADTLTGGIGANTYAYTVAGQSSVTGSTGFDTITDLKAGAVGTGDIIDFGGANAVTVAATNTLATGDAALGNTLAATLDNVYGALAADTVYTLNITAPVSFAGTYVVANQGLAAGAFSTATSQIISVNGITGLTAANFS